MKIAALTCLARQVEGEMVFFQILKANTDVEKLRKFLNENDLPRTRVIDEIQCVVEYGIVEDIEVETE